MFIKQQPQTAEEARQYAIDWQQWHSGKSLSYEELINWALIFTELADRFDLTEELKENGII